MKKIINCKQSIRAFVLLQDSVTAGTSFTQLLFFSDSCRGGAGQSGCRPESKGGRARHSKVKVSNPGGRADVGETEPEQQQRKVGQARGGRTGEKTRLQILFGQ